MLNFLEFSSFKQKQKWVDSISPNNQTLVVADLQSKAQYQKQFLSNKCSILEEDSVLRAAELWQKFIIQKHPDIQVISNSLTKISITQLLQDCPWDWAKTPGTPSVAYDYIQQFLPILSSSNGPELLAEWLKANRDSYSRWGQWLELSYYVWGEFQSQKNVPGPWVPSLLINSNLSFSWNRDLIFDLGVELTPVEADLIKSISESNNVTVLQPQPEWSSHYYSCLWPYSILKDKSLSEDLPEKLSSGFKFEDLNCDVKYYRYSTMLAEVKGVCSQVRQWLDQGIEPQKVAVVAPDIEEYWGVLSHYFKLEGVPVSKGRVTVLHSFPDISRWFSKLKLKMDRVSNSSLELAYYLEAEEDLLTYEKFSQLFTTIYDGEDLARNKKIKFLFNKDLDSSELLSRDEFAIWALRHWSENEPIVNLQKLFDYLLSECPPGQTLSSQLWLNYLEQLGSRIEVKVSEAEEFGIHGLNIDEVEAQDTSHVFFLGLCEEALKESRQVGVNLSEVLKLSSDTGFNLPFPDRAKTEFKLCWSMNKNYKSIVLSTSATNFSGQVKAPSLFWLKGSLILGVDPRSIQLPKPSRWDELQQSEISTIAKNQKWTEYFAHQLNMQISMDLDEAQSANFAVGREVSLSVTQLENYTKCPFIFAAQKLFHLRDLALVDLDIDAATKGSIMHALFAHLTVEPMRFDWTDDELNELIDKCRDENRYVSAHKKQWQFVRYVYLKLAKDFIEKERAWRTEFPELKTIAREVPIKAYWDFKKGTLSDKPESLYEFKGSIDRVDQDKQGHYAIIDYKSSDYSVRNYKGWLENNNFQLTLYGQAVEMGFADIPSGEVIGAFYYIAKDFNREKGYRKEGAEGTLFGENRRNRSQIKAEELKALNQSINTSVQKVVEGVNKGEFNASPKDIKECENCNWSQVCRAPHLN